MAQDQTPDKEQVLIARNNETGQTGAVAGLNEDGTPIMKDVKTASLGDLVKFNIRQNPIEAFLSNFMRQCKNPSLFGFFKADAETFDKVGPVMAEMLKDPEANKDLLAPAKVELPSQEESKKESHYKAIDPDKVDWEELGTRWGIDRKSLDESGDLREMLYNRKSGLVTVTPTLFGEKYTLAARLSFRTDPDGSVKVIPHFICRQPRLDEEFKGMTFTEEDKANLRNTGNLGRVADLTDSATGEKVPSYVSIDRYTNEIVSVPVKDVYVRDTIGQTKLTMQEVEELKSGKALPPKRISGKNGKEYTVTLQISADRRDVEFVPKGAKKQKQSQSQDGAPKVKTNTWLTKDGTLKHLSQWDHIPLTEQQQKDYESGGVAVLTNRVDKKGNPCTLYLWYNPEKQRAEAVPDDPRQGKTIAPSNESRVQTAVNNDGKTNEATKGIKEPLDKGQTAPKDSKQKKQSKGRKM